MAISAPHYRALKQLFVREQLPQHQPLLEIGEANYYGDMPLGVLLDDIATLGGERAERLTARFHELFESESTTIGGVTNHRVKPRTEWAIFDLVKLIYDLYLQPTSCEAIDLTGTPAALKHNLNYPLDLGRQFGTVINHGTAEHIFSVGNVFKIMHDHCAAGGLMIHESPFTGWIDHGFYCLQPTLYLDVAATNSYELLYLAVTDIDQNELREIRSREELLDLAASKELPNNGMLFVASRKQENRPFRVPEQGYYAGTLGKQAAAAWKTLR